MIGGGLEVATHDDHRLLSAFLRSPRGHGEIVERARDRGRRPQTGAHRSDTLLDLELQRHRIADTACDCSRGLHRVDDGLRHRHAECGEQDLRFADTQRRTTGRECARAHSQRRRDVRRRQFRLRRRNFEQPLLVAPVRSHERKGLDRVFRGVEIHRAAPPRAPRARQGDRLRRAMPRATACQRLAGPRRLHVP